MFKIDLGLYTIMISMWLYLHMHVEYLNNPCIYFLEIFTIILNSDIQSLVEAIEIDKHIKRNNNIRK